MTQQNKDARLSSLAQDIELNRQRLEEGQQKADYYFERARELNQQLIDLLNEEVTD